MKRRIITYARQSQCWQDATAEAQAHAVVTYVSKDGQVITLHKAMSKECSQFLALLLVPTTLETFDDGRAVRPYPTNWTQTPPNHDDLKQRGVQPHTHTDSSTGVSADSAYQGELWPSELPTTRHAKRHGTSHTPSRSQYGPRRGH